MRKPYPSDISREAFKEIEPLLLSGRKQTRPFKDQCTFLNFIPIFKMMNIIT